MPKRALAGNCTPGMISVMLLKKMKKKSAVRYGRYFSPSVPIVCMMIWLRTKPTPDSAEFCRTPDGTSASLRRVPNTNSRIVATVANT